MTTLITGATRGLGRVAAEHLLHAGRDLVVLARGRTDLARELRDRTGNHRVRVVDCDLGSLEAIRAAVALVDEPLDGFLGNAGVQATTTDTTTADGFERTFGVNVLAYHLLLTLLADRFTAPARLVVVGSDVHDPAHGSLGLVPPPAWTSPLALARPRPGGGRDARRAYATSKLGVLYLVHAFARLLPESVTVHTYNPGLVPGTGLARDNGPIGRAVFRAVGTVLTLTPAATPVSVAGRLMAESLTGPQPGETGSYVSRGAVVRSSAESYDRAREDELITAADDLCGITRATRPA
ncbi:SDR family NAD(P)-dependent oxidoreductase [Actinosynnema sp. NPDC020468]|uniref:SDR family NAD(P)-dependent oxidoreductase n=1 Tax=Actinosynnema sp. NPDC020468 TaxID=3154488 RepID=UPI0033CF2FB9